MALALGGAANAWEAGVVGWGVGGQPQRKAPGPTTAQTPSPVTPDGRLESFLFSFGQKPQWLPSALKPRLQTLPCGLRNLCSLSQPCPSFLPDSDYPTLNSLSSREGEGLAGARDGSCP